MKYEHRVNYDAYGTGNFTEIKDERITHEITEERAMRMTEYLAATGASHYETAKAHIYEKQTDARHVYEYIFYK